MDKLLNKLHLSDGDGGQRPQSQGQASTAAPLSSTAPGAATMEQGGAPDEVPRFPTMDLAVAPVELGTSANVPSLVLRPVDKYVDGLRPVLTPMLVREIDEFQTATLDSIERHLRDAWHGIFDGNLRILSRKPRAGAAARNTTSTRSAVDGVDDVVADDDESEGSGLPAYGELGEPFADLVEDLSDVLSSDYDPLAHASPEARQAVLQSEARRQAELARRERGGSTAGSFLGVAMDRIVAFAESSQAQMGLGLTPDEERLLEGAAKARLRKEATRRGKTGADGELHDLGAWVSRLVRSNQGDDLADPEAAAGRLTPALKRKVGALLAHAHAPLAEALTALALGHLKRWLRGNTEPREVRELTEGLLDGELEAFRESVAGFAGKMFGAHHHHGGVHRLFHSGKHEAGEGVDGSREAQERAIAAAAPPASAPATTTKAYTLAALLSRKLTRGLTFVRKATRADVRRMLAKIESFVFEMLPGCLQGPLATLLGGNPFESTSKAVGAAPPPPSSRALGLTALIEPLLGALQRALRTRLLEVVGGGHRRLEARAWGHVQIAVVGKVGKWVKGIRVEIAEPPEGEAGRSAGAGAEAGAAQDEADERHRSTLGMHHQLAGAGGEAAGFYAGEAAGAPPPVPARPYDAQSGVPSAYPQPQTQSAPPNAMPTPEHQQYGYAAQQQGTGAAPSMPVPQFPASGQGYR